MNNRNGIRYWDKDVHNPHERRPFVFATASAARAKAEHAAVRKQLQRCNKLPDANYEGRKVIEAWLRSAPDSKPETAPFVCWCTAEQWYWISRCLREWQLDGNVPYEYQAMVRAKKRAPEWIRRNW